ncbi:peptidoglycan-binding protein [Streptomyces sp. NPDC060334]|uniref:peptidoglycan-binding domain-containing protein n=1 Tax=unclassified Streptomyces TaxID=2593676 RepID=UPI00364C1349
MWTRAEIQRQLNELGAQPPLNVDGIAGPKTKRALVEFQRKHGLAADGIAGPKTRRAISDALAAGVPPPSPAPVPAAPALEWKLERGTYTFNRTFTRQIADHAARYKLEKRTTEMFECNIAGSLVTKGLVIGRVPGVGAYIVKGKSSMCKRMTKRAANDLVATAKEAAAANACLVNETGDYAGFFQGGETFRVERGTKCWN